MFEGLEKRVNNKGNISYWKDGKIVYKQCSKCKEIKNAEEFNKDNKNKDCKASKCRKCSSRCKSEDVGEFKKEILYGTISYWKDGVLVARQCSVCGKDKPIEEFRVKNKEKGTYRSECKECSSNREKRWREENSEHIKEWREVNKERRKSVGEQWRIKNREHLKENTRKFIEKNPEYYKEYKKRNKEKIKEYHKEYYQKNIEQRREYRLKNIERYKELDKKRIERDKKENLIKIANELKQVNSVLNQLNISLYGSIYKITNVKTGHVYIGQTVQSLKGRYHGGIIKKWIKERNHHQNQKFKEELIEEDFIYEVLDVAFCQYHLDKLEVYYIDKYDSFLNGYNNTPGNHATDDGKEEFENILKENNLEFIDGELRRIV